MNMQRETYPKGTRSVASSLTSAGSIKKSFYLSLLFFVFAAFHPAASNAEIATIQFYVDGME